MSENYQTEEEQIEAIKRWWKENGKSTLLGIALAIGGVFGWKGWQEQQQDASYSASSAYQGLLAVVDNNQQPLTDEQISTANHLADILKNDFSSSAYAQFAALYKAQLAVKANDLDTAEAELRWVLLQGPAAEVKAQTHLRLARVLLAKQQYDQALSELTAEALAYKPLYLELKGDIYVAKGDVSAARDAYQQAQSSAVDNAPNSLLELKIQQLKIAEEV